MTFEWIVYTTTIVVLLLLTAYGLYPLFSDAAGDVIQQVFIPMPTRES